MMACTVGEGTAGGSMSRPLELGTVATDAMAAAGGICPRGKEAPKTAKEYDDKTP